MVTKLEFYTRTQETWEAMYQDCQQAQVSINFEQYMLLGDEVGNRFLKLFRDKARSGVSVHLLLDAFGSWSVRSSPLLKELQQAGGRVRFYKPLSLKHLLRPSSWWPRDHCKTMLIDSKIAYTGSACMAAPMRDWHDLHARITGNLVHHMQAGTKRTKTQNAHQTTDKGRLRYVAKFSKFKENPIYNELLTEIKSAEQEICLVTPYFFPPMRLRKELKAAVKRGVDVRIIVSEKTDIPLATFISRSYFRSLMRAGIQIKVFHENVLHAKYAIIDDRWATMGSTNWDYLSLFYNREANLIIEDKEIIGELKALFENDAAVCKAAESRLPLWMRLTWPLIRRIRKVL
ncbi:MAG: phospholipase D-like domain-containing protein [Pseudomonadota bacterium]